MLAKALKYSVSYLLFYGKLVSMNKVAGLVRRCVEDYDMIADGETLAVCVSGGKDSVALLCLLKSLSFYYPNKFKLHALTVSMGFEGMDFTPLERLCGRLEVPFTLHKTDIGRLIFEERMEKNPCALCSKMRRGVLNELAAGLGIRKLAFAHNYDDAVETFFMSLFFEGRLGCFQPVTYMSRADVVQIRPLLYAGEGTISELVKRRSLPVIENACPMNGKSKREEVKKLIKSLSADYPGLKNKVFGAMQRLPLEGWRPKKYKRRPLP